MKDREITAIPYKIGKRWHCGKCTTAIGRFWVYCQKCGTKINWEKEKSK